jgi:hypothetical protein
MLKQTGPESGRTEANDDCFSIHLLKLNLCCGTVDPSLPHPKDEKLSINLINFPLQDDI